MLFTRVATMSDMKCPVCNKGTVKEFETAPYFMCSNGFCPSYSETDTTEYDILIRTRKELEIAVDALKRIEKELYFNNAKQTGHIADSVMSIPSIALEQITALEQKD